MSKHYRFRVVSGSFSDGGRNYKKGEVFQTTKNLAKTFPNSFELLGEKELAEKEEAAGGAKAVEPPSTGRSDPLDPPAGSETGETDAQKQEAAKEAARAPENLGVEVTTEYPSAVDNELRVFKGPGPNGKGERFNVIKAAEPAKTLNEAPLTAKGLAKLLENFEEGDEEETE